MADVIAKEKGYFGGVVREVGARFTVPDAVWDDPTRRPKWCAPAAFGGKGDHDGDGKIGGAKPKADKPAGDTQPKAVEVPADWSNLSAADRKRLAEAISGERPANVKEADEVISAYAAAAGKAEPFSDAPAPQTVAQAQQQSGGVLPDWVAPKAVAD